MAENSLVKPYFIKESINLSKTDKLAAYEQIQLSLRGILVDESDEVTKMATLNSLLKIHLPYAYWVGFYLVKGQKLKVGPYQGTIGCLDIEFGRGVCGKVAITKVTEIVTDVHQLTEGAGHITCDPNSRSEIVVPIFHANNELFGVLDIDSTQVGSFDLIDKQYLEQMLMDLF